MESFYSDNKNAQIIVSLLRQYHIKKVIASPGTMNINIVGSMQHDSFFEMYSCVDERSAAYMACGMAAASGEPVVIICTEATASRNYLPALTEAHYRQLPIVVITGTHGSDFVGHLHSQVIDRSVQPKDTVRISVSLRNVTSEKDERINVVKVNKALQELYHHGCGPVHIDVEASGSHKFSTRELPACPVITRHYKSAGLPGLPQGKTVVFIGVHRQMTAEEVSAIDKFCKVNDAVVFGDHTCGYRGRYLVNYALVACQKYYESNCSSPDLLIHLGEVSGDTYTTRVLKPKETWRVSEDGELRDTFNTLSAVFEMSVIDFFNAYNSGDSDNDSLYSQCQSEYENLYQRIPELGLGNIWIAKEMSGALPKGCTVHFGIFNSLRSWNFFRLDSSIHSCCNVGGFGIDGAVSTLIGASLTAPQRIHYLCVGDLAFFYDLNSLGNRHVCNNVRILLINNGRGIEFRKKDHPGHLFGESADLYIAAGGHFGMQSHSLVRHLAEDLGFEYLTAADKEEFRLVLPKFTSDVLSERPMILEVFPEVDDEVNNLDKVRTLVKDGHSLLSKIQRKVGKFIG